MLDAARMPQPVLSYRQQEVYDFIRTETIQNGIPPTLCEIGAEFNINLRWAASHLRALERKGAIARGLWPVKFQQQEVAP